jgi:glycosyltransferase involved in cell wall biosynthesis
MSARRILHLITDLDVGGAEMSLFLLLSGMDRQKFDNFVVCLIPPGRIGKQIKELGIPVETLNMKPGLPTPGSFLRLIALLRKFRPHVLQTWLYHADLMGLVAGKLAGIPTIFWNIRSSNMDFTQYRRLSGIVARACAYLAAGPDAVIINSLAGQVIHKQLGYHPRAWKLIPNGVDTQRFHPDQNVRRAIRSELELSEDKILIGNVARYDPMKGHVDLLKAAGLILRTNSQVHFLLVGDRISPENNLLIQMISENQLEGHIHLLGAREDVEKIDAAIDLFVSSSIGEGFPNAVAEAMSCAVPCVVTDTGDSGKIVAQTGEVVPPRDPEALSDACLRLLNLTAQERKSLGEKARQRISQEFSLERMIASYENLYMEMAV